MSLVTERPFIEISVAQAIVQEIDDWEDLN